MNPNAKIDLGEVSESGKSKDHKIGFQQSYAQTDEHKDDCKGVPSLQLEERCEIDDESDNYWDAYEEINEHKEVHGEDASPQSEEVKKASKDPTNILSDSLSNDLDKTVEIPGNTMKHEIDVPDGKLRPGGPAEIKTSHIST